MEHNYRRQKFLFRYSTSDKSIFHMIILPYLITTLIASFKTISNNNNHVVSAAPSIRYDQSQSGDYNVQIHLKNLELYAILDDGLISGDYDYDYGDLTEKPPGFGSNISTSYIEQWWLAPNGSTVRPPNNNNNNPNLYNNNNNFNNNNTPNLNNSYYSNYYNNNGNNLAGSSSTGEPYVIGNSGPLSPNKIIYQSQSNSIAPIHISPTTVASSGPGSESTFRINRKCGPGFYRDHFGKCRKKPHLPYLVHTPGVIKSFQQSVKLDGGGIKSSAQLQPVTGLENNSSTTKPAIINNKQ